MSSRLDNFTDAAFAFAVTLLVIGGSEAPTSTAMLAAAVAEVPAFAIGFAIIAMFWFAHVRWRAFRGEGDALSALEARRNPALDEEHRWAVRGESFIWLILAFTGLLSIAMTRFEASEDFAPVVYATLPLTIGLFVWRYYWAGGKAAEEE